LPTPKFWELRKMMEKYSSHKLPSVPKAPMKIITIPKFELTEFVPLVAAMGKSETGTLRTFEEMDLGWGIMLYSTRLPEITSPSVLTADFHDYAQVYVGNKYIGKIDRVKNERSITLPPVKKGEELVIRVEAMGRINFGRAIKDFKGIVSAVTISAEIDDTEVTWKPKMWTNVAFPDDYETAKKALDMVKDIKNADIKGSFQGQILMQGYEGSQTLSPLLKAGYHRGYFDLKKVGDTFLNFETWGKGQVWVNGHAMGRIWSIGPQQTLYVPGCWLKKGKNEVIVLDIAGPSERVVWGQAEPELNKLQLEKNNKHNNPGDKPDLNSRNPVFEGELKAGNGWQTLNFKSSYRGRHLAIEVQSTQKEGDVTAIAELYALSKPGERISREPWTVKYADSEDENGNHLGDKVFDLQESTYWQTEKGASTPHLLVIDLGSEQQLMGIEYLPRAEQGAPGSIKNVRIFLY